MLTRRAEIGGHFPDPLDARCPVDQQVDQAADMRAGPCFRPPNPSGLAAHY